jgi:hypothetical protein
MAESSASSGSKPELDGGLYINGKRPDGAREQDFPGRKLRNLQYRRDGPSHITYTCECCGWNDDLRWSSLYESNTRVVHTADRRGIWELGDSFIFKDDHSPQCRPGRPNEVGTLNFLRERTTIPLPPPGGVSWSAGGRTFDLIPRVPGQTLQSCFWRGIPATFGPGLDSIYQELGSYLRQIRQLTRTRCESFDGKACGGGYRFGIRGGLFPHTREEFLHYLATKRVTDPKHTEAERKAFRERCPSFEPYVFSHGDLDPSNIMVKDGSISGIIDWEHSGFYPVWYEYLKAYLWPPSNASMLTDYIGEYPEVVKWFEELEIYYPYYPC